MLFELFCKKDLDKWLHRRPWTFEKHLVTKDYDKHTRPSKLHMHKETFWIYVHDLFMILMSKSTRKRI